MSDRIGLRLVSCERCGVAYNARTNHRCAFRHLPDCQCDFVLIDECCLARERLDAVEASRARIEAETIEKVVAWHRSEAERHMLRAEKCLDGSLAESEAKRAMHMHIVIASCIERGEWRKEA